MAALFKRLSKKDRCEPLRNIQGRASKKYKNFKHFLNHNYAALDIMAEMEQMYYSGKPFSLDLSIIKYQELAEAAMGAVYALDNMSSGWFSSLMDVFNEIDGQIADNFSPEFSFPSKDIVIPLENISPEMKGVVGAKAANLAAIKNILGLPVPHGFAVTAYAFERFLKDAGMSELIRRELSKVPYLNSVHALRDISEKLRGMILQATVPASVADHIMDAYESIEKKTQSNVRISLRSSAIGEDTEASFAGQYTSVLNVAKDDILKSYRTVIASKYSVRAINYMFQYGLHDRETPMAVLGLVMVDAVSSGVAYSRNPSHDKNHAVKISSIWGLGEYLVSGNISPDALLVDRNEDRIIGKDIRRKEYKIIRLEQGGTQVVEVAEGEKDKPSIEDAQIFDIRNYTLMLEDFFKGPQDIEWAIDKDHTLYILQSRPLNIHKPSGVTDAEHKEYKFNPVLFTGGKTASLGIAAGKTFIIKDGINLYNIPENSILVAKTASPDYVSVIDKVNGIITDIGSATSHLSSVAREFGIPAIVAAKNASSVLPDGDMITMSADAKTVYKGVVEELLTDKRPYKRLIFESPVHQRMRRVLDRISPLNLVDPNAPAFLPEGCKTIHDIIRFTHEQAINGMFGLAETLENKDISVRLTSNIPFYLYLIDLGGGLRENLTTCNTITPDHIESIPMKAIWRGFAHPGITWAGAISFDAKKFMTLLASTATSEFGESPGGASYAVLSTDYMNLSALFGYHFATVDALCGENSDQNYISLQFSGGVGSYYGRSLRIQFLGNVLEKLGFKVSIKGDLIDAFISRYDRPFLEEALDQMGRLLASSRLLDMAISNQEDVAALATRFFKGDYDFLSRRQEDEPDDFYIHGGHWKKVIEDGQMYCVQDGTKSGFSISSGVAGIMGRLVGQSLQDFLDTVEAYYYFPLAIAKGSDMSDGKINVRVKPVKGNIDRAGGIAFGVRNVANYFVFRINALEDNAILFEYINNKRVQRAAAKETIMSDRWYNLSVEVSGNIIRGYINNRQVLEYIADISLHGFTGLWTKADSVTYFEGLTIQTGGNAQKFCVNNKEVL